MENLVTPADVQRWPAASPQRTLMKWWRDIQYNDLTDYMNLLATPVRKQRELDSKARTELPDAQASLISAKPEISQAVINGDRATVWTQIAGRAPIGSTRFVVSRVPQAFALVKERDGWRLADDLFVEHRANQFATAVRQSKKR